MDLEVAKSAMMEESVMTSSMDCLNTLRFKAGLFSWMKWVVIAFDD